MKYTRYISLLVLVLFLLSWTTAVFAGDLDEKDEGTPVEDLIKLAEENPMNFVHLGFDNDNNERIGYNTIVKARTGNLGYRTKRQNESDPKGGNTLMLSFKDWGMNVGAHPGKYMDVKVSSKQNPDPGEGNVVVEF